MWQKGDWLNLFDKHVELIQKNIRRAVLGRRQVVYLSCPISSYGGSFASTNVEIAHFTAQHLAAEWGPGFWFLNPAQYQMESQVGLGVIRDHARELELETPGRKVNVDALMNVAVSGCLGTELWRQALPRRAHPRVDLTEEMLLARVGTMRVQAKAPPQRMDEVGYFYWALDTRPEEAAWEHRMWVREGRAEGDEDGDDVEVATTLAGNAQAVYAGTCEGDLLGWSWQGNPQMRLRVTEEPIWCLCVDARGLRAAQSQDTVIYFREGSISGKSSYGDQRPSMEGARGEVGAVDAA